MAQTRSDVISLETVASLKQRQIEHANAAFREPHGYEGNRFHDHFRALPFRSLARLLEERGLSLDGKRVLVASCGNGIDLHYLRKFYDADWFVTDIGQSAVDATRRAFPGVDGQVEDNEHLSFGDGEFDFAFVAGALHHLPRPTVGLYELLRVSRLGVIAIEPNDSWLTRWATRRGLATEYEDAGNYVYRFSRWDVERIARSIYAEFGAAPCFATHRVARGRVEFALLRAANALANAVCPSWGNHLVFTIGRPDGS